MSRIVCTRELHDWDTIFICIKRTILFQVSTPRRRTRETISSRWKGTRASENKWSWPRTCWDTVRRLCWSPTVRQLYIVFCLKFKKKIFFLVIPAVVEYAGVKRPLAVMFCRRRLTSRYAQNAQTNERFYYTRVTLGLSIVFRIFHERSRGRGGRVEIGVKTILPSSFGS